MKAVPVDSCRRAVQPVDNVYHHQIVLAHMQERSRDFSIDAHYTAIDTVRGDALWLQAVHHIAVEATTARPNGTNT